MTMRRSDICGKLKTFARLVHHIDCEGEKVLVFSFSVQTLNVLEAFARGEGRETISFFFPRLVLIALSI